MITDTAVADAGTCYRRFTTSTATIPVEDRVLIVRQADSSIIPELLPAAINPINGSDVLEDTHFMR